MNKVAIAAFVAALVKQLASCNPPCAPEDIYSNLHKIRENLTADDLAAALKMVDEFYYFPQPPPASDYLRQAKDFLGIE